MTARMAAAALAAVGLFTCTSVAGAQVPVKKVPMRPIASAAGKDVYKAYCENCHGEDLKGHGPDAASLRVPPPDLTTLAVRSGGKFSSGGVTESILGWKKVPRTMTDARDMTQAMDKGENVENAPVMPPFGPIFGALYPQEARDRNVRISNLVGYLKKMQGTAAPPEPPK